MLLLWRRVSANPSQGRVSGDFLPKQEWLLRAERPKKASLFVCFECDSLSEKLRKGGEKVEMEIFRGNLSSELAHANTSAELSRRALDWSTRQEQSRTAFLEAAPEKRTRELRSSRELTTTACPKCLNLPRRDSRINQSLRPEALRNIGIQHHASSKMAGIFGNATASSTNAANTLGDLSRDVALSDPPEDSISDLSFSPQSLHLAVASWDKKVRIYEITSTGASNGKAFFDCEGPVLSCDWSPVSREHLAGMV